MARSKKNGVTPTSETKTPKTMKGGKSNSENPPTGKSGNKSSSKKKRKSKKDSKVDTDNVNFDQDQTRSTGGTAGESGHKRDAMREEVMTQVLQDYHAKPIAEKEVQEKEFVWPFFRLRKLLGWAHVELHDAVLDGNVSVVKATLLRYIRKSPGKINKLDEEGRTALSLALMEQREDIADLIISVDDTDVNIPDAITGLSPLHNAVLLDLGSSAQKLAFRGANVNSVDKVGMTPLMLACRLGHESMVDMMVNVFGAEIDPADKAGWTSLFYATYHNESNIVQYLLVHGADLDKKDKRGMTAVDWGEHMGFGETCAVFSSFESQLAP